MTEIEKRLTKMIDDMVIKPTKNMSEDILHLVNMHNGSVQQFLTNAIAMSAISILIEKEICTEDELFKYIEKMFDTNAHKIIQKNTDMILLMIDEEAKMMEDIQPKKE